MRPLLATAAILNGLLAGANADRLLVGIPALRKLGPVTWGEYSRNADLAPSGMVFYPTLAIGGTILTIAAACSGRLQPAERGMKPAPTHTAAILALAGLLLTFKAGPNML